jgi:hypothetical protein
MTVAGVTENRLSDANAIDAGAGMTLWGVTDIGDFTSGARGTAVRAHPQHIDKAQPETISNGRVRAMRAIQPQVTRRIQHLRRLPCSSAAAKRVIRLEGREPSQSCVNGAACDTVII